MKGWKVTVKNDPTSPIFQSTTSGGLDIAGHGIDYENSKTITSVKNIDKHTGKVETNYVQSEGSALVVGKLADALVKIKSEVDKDNGNLVTTVDTSATGLLGKPKISAVDAHIEQKELDSGFFKGPDVKVIADSRAKVDATQVEKKADSGVKISTRVRNSSM